MFAEAANAGKTAGSIGRYLELSRCCTTRHNSRKHSFRHASLGLLPTSEARVELGRSHEDSRRAIRTFRC